MAQTAEETTIFIFDAEEGMVVSKDIHLPDGHILVKKDTPLTLDLIATISSYHILEINVYAQEDDVEEEIADIPISAESQHYYDAIRSSEQFKKFNEAYQENVVDVKGQLNDIVTNNTPIDTEELLKGTTSLIAENRNSLQLFDMLHSMRQQDDLTFVHCINVSLIASIIGQWMKFSEEDIKTLTLCGLLHDIGKLMIPNEILTKPGKLTNEEFTIMKKHVNLGYDKLKTQHIDTRVMEACLLHHEKCDGTGYPFKLKSDKIPPAAKIIAVADVYDAMTAARVYRGALCPFEVIKMMYSDAFTKFDPKYCLPFLKNVASSYIHNDVRLSNGKAGKVILINDNALYQPIVQCDDEFIDLSKNPSISITAIL